MNAPFENNQSSGPLFEGAVSEADWGCVEGRTKHHAGLFSAKMFLRRYNRTNCYDLPSTHPPPLTRSPSLGGGC